MLFILLMETWNHSSTHPHLSPPSVFVCITLIVPQHIFLWINPYVDYATNYCVSIWRFSAGIRWKQPKTTMKLVSNYKKSWGRSVNCHSCFHISNKTRLKIVLIFPLLGLFKIINWKIIDFKITDINIFKEFLLVFLKMKLALIFLSVCVAISQQQYFHPRMMMGNPWMSPFAQHPMYFNKYMMV